MRKILSSIIAASVFVFAADGALATQPAKKPAAQPAKKPAAQAATKPVSQAAKKPAVKTAKKKFRLPKLPPPGLTGIASVYRYKKPSRSASGEIINFKGMIAAHRTFRFGTKVRVTNRRNGKSVVVRIIDRGPFIRGRVIDLSPAAARQIGLGWGLAPVTLAVVGNKA